MIARKITWLLLVLCLAEISVTNGSWGIFGFLMTVILLPVLSLPIGWMAARRLRLCLTGPINLRKGQTGETTLLIENPTWLPVLFFRCRLTVENALTGEKEQCNLTASVLPHGRKHVVLDLKGTYCGRLRLSIDRGWLYDCFGVLGWPLRTDAAASVTVQPDTFIQKILLSSSCGCPDDSEVYAPDKPGHDLTEIFQIREYQIGDSLRQVHWKLSTKLERLIIRDPSLPLIRSVVVFWERTTAEEETAEEADRQAEIVVTACKALVEQSIHFTMIWNDTRNDLCKVFEIKDMDDLIGLVPRLLQARSRAGGVSGAEAFLHTVGEGVYSHILYIADTPTALAGELERLGRLTQLCPDANKAGDGQAIYYDPARYMDALMEIEI